MPAPDRQIGALILEKVFGVICISDLDRSSWSDTSLDHINFSSKNINVSKTKMAVVFNALRIIKRFYVLQGDPKSLTLPNIIIDIQMMTDKIEKGLKTICDLQKVDFPKKLTPKNWQFLKKEIVSILSTYGLDWTISGDPSLNKRLSNGVGCWICKNLVNSKYEHLATGNSGKEVWENMCNWFSTEELDPNKKSWIRTRLDGIKLNSVANIENFVNKYTL